MLQLVHEQGNTLVLYLSTPLISGSQYYLLTPIEMQGGDDVTGAHTPPSKKRVSMSRQTHTFLADQFRGRGVIVSQVHALPLLRRRFRRPSRHVPRDKGKLNI